MYIGLGERKGFGLRQHGRGERSGIHLEDLYGRHIRVI